MRPWLRSAVIRRDVKVMRRIALGRDIGVAMAKCGQSIARVARELGVAPQTVKMYYFDALRRFDDMDSEEQAALRRFVPPSEEGTLPAKCLELRMGGATWKMITESLHVDDATAQRYVLRELDRLRASELWSADYARQMQLERLETALRGIWPGVLAGDEKAVNAMLKIMEREAKLVGMDAPVKIDLEQQIRSIAAAEGMDADEAVAEALRIMKALPT